MHSRGKNPKIIAWEITRRCELKCRHCRGAARDCDYAGEFSTEECYKTIDSLADFSQPMIILTGGEPLVREDIFLVAKYAAEKDLRVVMATCGHLVTPRIAAKMKASGIMAVSVSLDSDNPEAHDIFRGIPGAYEKTLEALEHLKAQNIPFQINTTVSKLNVKDLPQILEKAVQLGASTMDFFFLVPTGRGTEIARLALDPEERDRALEWIAEAAKSSSIRVKTTCAPQYKKFIGQGAGVRGQETGGPELTRHSPPATRHFMGCMGGRGFVFISHTGVLQTCGFLDLPCGDLRSADFDFGKLYNEAEVFKNMRSLNPFDGCPARAHARTGDYMEPEE